MKIRPLMNFLSTPSLSRGSASIYVFLILVLLVAGSVFIAGGVLPGDSSYLAGTPGYEKVDSVVPNVATNGARQSLQLITLKGKECEKTTAVDLLIDQSGSMGRPTLDRPTKMIAAQEALRAFAGQLSEDSVIGMQSFSSSIPILSPSGTRDLVQIGLYNDQQKTNVENAIRSLRAMGSTWMRQGMELARQKIEEAKPQFPQYKFNLILLSDGVPAPNDGTHDPLTPPNIADQIKAAGVTIYTIGILGGDVTAEHENRLRSIASSPSNYYRSPTGDNLVQIYNQIGQKICK